MLPAPPTNVPPCACVIPGYLHSFKHIQRGRAKSKKRTPSLEPYNNLNVRGRREPTRWDEGPPWKGYFWGEAVPNPRPPSPLARPTPRLTCSKVKNEDLIPYVVKFYVVGHVCAYAAPTPNSQPRLPCPLIEEDLSNDNIEMLAKSYLLPITS